METTERIGSVAALYDTKLLYELRLDSTKRSAQALVPGMKRLLAEVGWRPADVDLVATTVGPGSFTGLRLGVTTAKTFAYSAGADILGIDTLEAIAAAVPDDVQDLSVAVDAQRGQIVAGWFRRREQGPLHPAGASKLVDIDAWLGGLTAGSCVTGPVLRTIADRIPEQVKVLDQCYWSPAAAAVGRLAARHYADGRRHDLWMLVPRYSRRSAAEEKWQERQR